VSNKVVSGIIAAAGLAAVVAPAFGQAAVTSNQRWDVRYVIERFADVSEGGGLRSTQTFVVSWNGATWSAPTLASSSGDLTSRQNIGRVDITLSGRVGTVGTTANFGVNRLGGTGSTTTGFRMTFSDAGNDPANPNHRVDAGSTGGLGSFVNDTNGGPLTGTYNPFRVGFSPTGSPGAVGSNTDPNNGTYSNPATGNVIVANLTGARGSNFGAETGNPATALGIGIATLDGNNNISGGDFANFYKMSYTPNKADNPATAYRSINLAIQGQTLRYLFQKNSDTNYSSSGNLTMTDHNLSFFVPTPGAAALVGLAGLATLRRRRA
jgi:hypothetical protein